MDGQDTDTIPDESVDVALMLEQRINERIGKALGEIFENTLYIGGEKFLFDTAVEAADTYAMSDTFVRALVKCIVADPYLVHLLARGVFEEAKPFLQNFVQAEVNTYLRNLTPTHTTIGTTTTR